MKNLTSNIKDENTENNLSEKRKKYFIQMLSMKEDNNMTRIYSAIANSNFLNPKTTMKSAILRTAAFYFICNLQFAICNSLFAQTETTIDTSKKINLQELLIEDHKSVGEMERMPIIKDNVIYAGKKNEVILMNKINADLSTNNTRQVFAKVPGITVWENDGSGIQVGVATRGLSPNRSWEFNVRQNGYDICSEVFGYPETYFSPPMEALEKIEVVRGAASLQYGPQFGGLLNYQIKKGNPDKAVSFETQQTVGSYGLFNTYNAIGGTVKKFSYYGYLHHRNAEGWRENSQYNVYTGYFSANYQLTKKINIGADYTTMDYKSQQPGGLTDTEFKENHRQSSRERNWFSAPWNVASLTIKYDVSEKINISMKTFATMAQRNSVGYMKAINVKDTILPKTLQYDNRQLDRDNYNNYGTEIRMSYKYNLFGQEHILATGGRAYNGNTERNQQAKGTTGADFDLTLVDKYGRALKFSTMNYAAFAENIFRIGKRLKVVPGVRYDYIENHTEGYINTTAKGLLNADKRTRQMFLYGIGTEFMVTDKTNVYANYSLSYRPVTFSELTPSATTEIIDQNLKDASGFNADLGYRGTIKNYLNFDVSAFYMNYDNRIGVVPQADKTNLKTNIGTSVSQGIESFVEISPIQIFNDNSKIGNISIFASNALIDAKYTKWENPSIANDPKKSIDGKKVENAPSFIHRFGATYFLKNFSATFQYSKVSSIFTDAVNTEKPNAAGTIGKLDGYEVMDASLSYKFMEYYNIKAGVNNIADENYATRRAGGYPGPGIMPGNGRTIFVSIGAKF